MTPARFRFAPSPTGIPHVGNLHTATFCWALARALGGDFLIRVEDTDPARNTPEAIALMLEALEWLGLDWDEGPDIGGPFAPYIQSQRIEQHYQVIEQLLEAGAAYYGDDPNHPAIPAGNPLRLRMPRTDRTIVHDAIRGEIVFDNSRWSDDPIIARSDGRPLYHLAAMVDDHDMGITHVVRGEDWIPSAPYHVQLYQAMGWPEPVWVHLPLILNKRGEKLKKRDPEGGYLISDFQEAGYLPQALFNYLLLLGWSPDGEEELIDKQQLRRQFRLERLSASPAIFDWDKLNWVNRRYLQRLSDSELAGLLRPMLEDNYGSLWGNEEWLVSLAGTIRDDLVRLSDAVKLAEWAIAASVEPDAEAREALATPEARPVLTELVAELAQVVLLDTLTADSILRGMRARWKQRAGWGPRQVYSPIRAALIGAVHGPPVAEIMALLGKERCLERVGAVLRNIHVS